MSPTVSRLHFLDFGGGNILLGLEVMSIMFLALCVLVFPEIFNRV